VRGIAGAILKSIPKRRGARFEKELSTPNIPMGRLVTPPGIFTHKTRKVPPVPNAE